MYSKKLRPGVIQIVIDLSVIPRTFSPEPKPLSQTFEFLHFQSKDISYQEISQVPVDLHKNS